MIPDVLDSGEHLLKDALSPRWFDAFQPRDASLLREMLPPGGRSVAITQLSALS
jgi:hypothetical protein